MSKNKSGPTSSAKLDFLLTLAYEILPPLLNSDEDILRERGNRVATIVNIVHVTLHQEDPTDSLELHSSIRPLRKGIFDLLDNDNVRNDYIAAGLWNPDPGSGNQEPDVSLQIPDSDQIDSEFKNLPFTYSEDSFLPKLKCQMKAKKVNPDPEGSWCAAYLVRPKKAVASILAYLNTDPDFNHYVAAINRYVIQPHLVSNELLAEAVSAEDIDNLCWSLLARLTYDRSGGVNAPAKAAKKKTGSNNEPVKVEWEPTKCFASLEPDLTTGKGGSLNVWCEGVNSRAKTQCVREKLFDILYHAYAEAVEDQEDPPESGVNITLTKQLVKEALKSSDRSEQSLRQDISSLNQLVRFAGGAHLFIKNGNGKKWTSTIKFKEPKYKPTRESRGPSIDDIPEIE